MSQQLIVIEQSAWNDLVGSVKTLTEEVKSLVKDRREPDTFTLHEAARYIGYSDRRLQQLKDERKIPYSQHSRRITFRREDLDNFLKEHRIEKRKT